MKVKKDNIGIAIDKKRGRWCLRCGVLEADARRIGCYVYGKGFNKHLFGRRSREAK